MVLDKEWLRQLARDAARVTPANASVSSTSDAADELERERRELAARKATEERERRELAARKATEERERRELVRIEIERELKARKYLEEKSDGRVRREREVRQSAIGAMLASGLLWAIGLILQLNDAAWLIESQSAMNAPYRYAMNFYSWTILGTFDLGLRLFSDIQNTLNAAFSNWNVASVCAFFLTSFIAVGWTSILYDICRRFARGVVIVHYAPLLCAVIWSVAAQIFGAFV